MGDRSAATFWQLWLVLRCWKCFLYITDGYPVYQCFIDEGDHLVSKLAMTRVEGENSRLRHKERTITSQDFLLFQVQGDAALFYSLTSPLFEVLDSAYSNSTIPIMLQRPSEQLQVPEGIHLVFLPAYSPQLQPTERLWPLVNEPLINEAFERIDEVEELVYQHCRRLLQQQELIRGLTLYHWLPEMKAA